MTIDRERIRQTILDEMGGNLTACFESAVDYYLLAENRINELEAEVIRLQRKYADVKRGVSWGAIYKGHLAPRISHPLKLDTYAQLDVADPVKDACPNG
jgi:hypothetical protein